ncbi:MAG TPA: ATP-binding protein [Miltoncostaeaceae bacterium]|nr:ATP-binding protein [Miltoncostaeaceae bacterium]
MEGRDVLSLVASPQAASIARSYTRDRLSGLPQPAIEDALLVVTEFVTNAVLHADCSPGTELSVACTVIRGHARIEVRDPGPCFDPGRRAAPEPGREGGRGLAIVGALARRWGAERSDDGCLAWAELDYVGVAARRPAPPAQAPTG